MFRSDTESDPNLGIIHIKTIIIKKNDALYELEQPHIGLMKYTPEFCTKLELKSRVCYGNSVHGFLDNGFSSTVWLYGNISAIYKKGPESDHALIGQ